MNNMAFVMDKSKYFTGNFRQITLLCVKPWSHRMIEDTYK